MSWLRDPETIWLVLLRNKGPKSGKIIPMPKASIIIIENNTAKIRCFCFLFGMGKNNYELRIINYELKKDVKNMSTGIIYKSMSCNLKFRSLKFITHNS